MKYAVAIDIGGTNTRVALIDEKYKKYVKVVNYESIVYGCR